MMDDDEVGSDAPLLPAGSDRSVQGLHRGRDGLCKGFSPNLGRLGGNRIVKKDIYDDPSGLFPLPEGHGCLMGQEDRFQQKSGSLLPSGPGEFGVRGFPEGSRDARDNVADSHHRAEVGFSNTKGSGEGFGLVKVAQERGGKGSEFVSGAVDRLLAR